MTGRERKRVFEIFVGVEIRNRRNRLGFAKRAMIVRLDEMAQFTKRDLRGWLVRERYQEKRLGGVADEGPGFGGGLVAVENDGGTWTHGVFDVQGFFLALFFHGWEREAIEAGEDFEDRSGLEPARDEV